MPNYDYKCGQCDVTYVIQRKVDERDSPATCTCCGAPCTRIVTAPKVLQYNSTTGFTDHERIKYRL
jgi:putative FmdB family regulatory protein